MTPAARQHTSKASFSRSNTALHSGGLGNSIGSGILLSDGPLQTLKAGLPANSTSHFARLKVSAP
ncbi:MAG: hypothetical protein MUF13_12970 [Akkermansiaceae bacterium]|nr:hypothetical protein [Akkermansiaceae bacterium]